MTINRFKKGDIVVAVIDLLSIDGKQHMFKGSVDKVMLAGSYNGHPYVLGFKKRIGHESYFDSINDNFRFATPEEEARFKVLGGDYLIQEAKFKLGDKIIALRDVSTVEDEYSVTAGYTDTVFDIIINRKDLSKSIFWFEDHPGVFYMDDNFELVNKL